MLSRPQKLQAGEFRHPLAQNKPIYSHRITSRPFPGQNANVAILADKRPESAQNGPERV